MEAVQKVLNEPQLKYREVHQVISTIIPANFESNQLMIIIKVSIFSLINQLNFMCILLTSLEKKIV